MKPIIIGSGLAGLTIALALAPRPVIVLSSRGLGDDTSSQWAQGGIAAAIGHDDDPGLHAADTMAAGAGLCVGDVVAAITNEAPSVIAHLVSQGIAFDKDVSGHIKLGLEAAHGIRRIVHGKGDGTGRMIMNTLIQKVRNTPSIEIHESSTATRLLIDHRGAISGVAVDRNDTSYDLMSGIVVLATGGAAALYAQTTNPLPSWGQGLALAARAGAKLADLEFMQFHPTAIDIGRDPMPLASEALRGEGAQLIDDRGYRFVDELQPRDIVARQIFDQIASGRKIYLDARSTIGSSFEARFPSIFATCISAGIDPSHDLIPVCPAAHYHMGGVETDLHGRTNISGLWAAGEVAGTGLHGANRLASNSLLEAAALGRFVAEDILGFSVPTVTSILPPSQRHARSYSGMTASKAVDVRSIMSGHVGLVRDRVGLEKAVASLYPYLNSSNMALVGFMIATFALQREESRGSHARFDFPVRKEMFEHRQISTLDDIVKLGDKVMPQSRRAAAGA